MNGPYFVLAPFSRETTVPVNGFLSCGLCTLPSFTKRSSTCGVGSMSVCRSVTLMAERGPVNALPSEKIPFSLVKENEPVGLDIMCLPAERAHTHTEGFFEK